MAFRYLIYSTGTTYTTTIVRESATNNPGVNEASYYTDFVIPEIQPLYLWRVNQSPLPSGVIPNTDANVYAFENATAPASTPQDLVNLGDLTGATAQKINIVTGATGNLGEFTADGNLVDTGYKVSDLTGGTTYNFVGSGGTQVFTSGTNPVTVTIYSTMPTGTTVAWGDITGDISNQSDLWNILTGITGETATKLDTSVFNSYTGTTETRLQGIEDDITGLTATKLNISVFNAYTGATQPVIDAAITGVTNLGTGTTLGSTSGRNITLKSISVLGGLSISGDADNLIISGGSTSSTAWGDITGTLSDQTDLWDTLTGMTATTATKLDTSVFNSYTGTTETRLQGIEDDITGLTATKLDTSVFNAYTGATQPVIDAALTGATNGLTATGRDVELGGALTKDTSITGTGFGLSANTKNILLQAINGINIIDTDGVGGINIESDAGTIALIGNTNLGAERTKLQISETQMLITDSRTTKVGLEYAADYSTTFTNESLITKRYADAIAAGLVPKEAVLVATTGAITLSGLTTIDGIALANGNRVLVKNQASAIDNGIYIASASTWSRAADFDDIPSVEVVSGNIIPVVSGNTNHNTLWVLITPNPVQVGTDPLNFTLFASPANYVEGVGINISGNTISVDGASLAGNSIAWTGNTFNVDVNSGTLQTALAGKQATITGAATTITTANLTIDRALISDGSGKVAVSTITSTELGYLSGTTSNIQSQLNSKLATSVFNTFTGTTLPANYYNKTEINAYTGATEILIGTKLDTTVFDAYTGATKNKDKKIQLVSTGTTDVNTVAATAIDWHSADPFATDIYSYTAGTSTIEILSGGTFEVQYHVTLKNSTANQTHSIGGYLIKNGLTTIPITATAAMIVGPSASGELSLPPVVLTLATNDKLDLAAFRIGNLGTVNIVSGSVYMVINKLT